MPKIKSVFDQKSFSKPVFALDHIRAAAHSKLMLLLAISGALFLFITLISANALQVASLVLWPFSRSLFRRVNRSIAHCWWGLSVLWTERVHNVRPIFSGDDVPEGENAMMIANHQQIPDIIALMMLGWRKKRLGDMKWFVKDVIKFVPGIGWGMLFLDCVFLKRNWDRDENRIRKTFAKFIQHKIPMWLVSFPEGTRVTPAKLAQTQAYAKKNGLRIPERVLIPRTRGFVAAVHGLEEHITALYDVTIAYPGRVPSLWQLFNTTNTHFHLHVRRYPIRELPKDTAALGTWLHARFAEKDALLEHFQKHGSFPASLPQEPIHTAP